MGSVPLGGGWRRGEAPAPTEVPSLGKSARTEKKLQRLRGEYNNWFVAGRTEAVRATTLCVPACDACLVVWSGSGCWNIGFRGQTQGENWCLLVQRQPKGTGVWGTALRSVRGRSLSCYRSAIVKWCAKEGVGLPLQPLSPLPEPCLHGLQGRLSPGQAHTPWPWPQWPQEHKPVGCLHAVVGLKSQLSPRGHVT